MRAKALYRSFRLSRFFATVVAACSAAAPLHAAGGDGAAFLETHSLSSSPSQILVVCHGFGCAYRNQFVLTPAKVGYLGGILSGAHSAKDERKMLAKAVAWFDRESGRAAGTVRRIARASVETKRSEEHTSELQSL
jgi:hypothetical protein